MHKIINVIRFKNARTVFRNKFKNIHTVFLVGHTQTGKTIKSNPDTKKYHGKHYSQFYNRTNLHHTSPISGKDSKNFLKSTNKNESFY